MLSNAICLTRTFYDHSRLIGKTGLCKVTELRILYSHHGELPWGQKFHRLISHYINNGVLPWGLKFHRAIPRYGTEHDFCFVTEKVLLCYIETVFVSVKYAPRVIVCDDPRIFLTV